MSSKLQIIKLNEFELSLIISALEQVTVKGRDCSVVASSLTKLDRARDRYMVGDGKPKEDEMIPLGQPPFQEEQFSNGMSQGGE